MSGYDPREAKLPKWAAEMLANARRRADLAWPNVQKPAPLARYDASGFNMLGPRSVDQEAWTVSSNYQSAKRIEAVRFDRQGYVGVGRLNRRRAQGTFWASEADAMLAAWWEAAEEAANALHREAQRVREAGL